MKTLRPRLTFANVVSCLALFVALGGSAYAATQLKKNAVGTKQIRNGAVSTAKLKKSAVNGAKVEDGSLTGADINQPSLTGVRAANVTGILVKGDDKCSPEVPFPAGVSAENLGPGICELTLPSSVAGCAASATVGGSLPIAVNRTAQTFREAKLPNQIRVITYQAEARSDLAFDLVLVC